MRHLTPSDRMSSKLDYHGITVLSSTSGVLYQILVVLRKVDQIVVYKVDRLTRCLSDFAKLVERLEAAGAVFVSVTQSFNTATSMGRLTLHMLLSFAQFEREVTAERIRDKIACAFYLFIRAAPNLISLRSAGTMPA